MVPESFQINYWGEKKLQINKNNAIFLQFTCVRRANLCHFDHVLHLAHLFIGCKIAKINHTLETCA